MLLGAYNKIAIISRTKNEFVYVEGKKERNPTLNGRQKICMIHSKRQMTLQLQ
jgi:hypothetical protein